MRRCVENGITYAIGQSFKKDCNTCRCTQTGTISCTLMVRRRTSGRRGGRTDARTASRFYVLCIYRFDVPSGFVLVFQSGLLLSPLFSLTIPPLSFSVLVSFATSKSHGHPQSLILHLKTPRLMLFIYNTCS